MDLELSKEHLMIKDSAADFIKKEHSLDDLKELRKEPLGHSRKIWRKMAELGWLELMLPEKIGGFGYDLSFAMVLLEEFGKGLLPSPWTSTVMLGGNLILAAGTEVQKRSILPVMASGDLWIALAYLEDQGYYDLHHCSTSAVRMGKEFILAGEKIFVMDGMAADTFIVSARTSGAVSDIDGITLFLVSKNAEGLATTPLKTIDGSNACMLRLNDVLVCAEDIIGEVDKGYPILSRTIDLATAGLCAEMVGGMNAVLDLAVWQLSNREQFGKTIGTFQALQHKAADMFVQKELATSAMYYAVASMIDGSEVSASAVSIAKAKCSSTYTMMAKQAVQMFGGYGFTNEADIGLYLRRAKATEPLFGDTNYHTERYAKLRDDKEQELMENAHILQ